MVEYIERSKAIEKGICVGICDAQENMYGAADVVFLDDIKKIPAADVAPVRHGAWTEFTESNFCFGPYGAENRITHKYRHDECGKVVLTKENYCPNCGMKMDGEV